jgi:predicted  nucleic acid-binding Zn-ribbon protein
MSEQAETLALLREIRDNQREALAVQREHITLYQRQLDRIERINDRAEAIQGRAAKAVRVILLIAIPLVCLLLVLMMLPYVFRLFA